MKIETRDFGTIEIGEEKIYHFTQPLFGFEQYTDFVVLHDEEIGGSIVWPILIHGTTDSATFLMVGNPAPGAISSLANLANPTIIVTGLILLIFIRGRVNARAGSAAAQTA